MAAPRAHLAKFLVSESSRPRAVITGFSAAHARLNADSGAWLEYSSLRPPALRDLFDLENPCTEYSVPPMGQWWERFFSCGIIRALETAGLWRDEKLSIAPQRVGVCFSSSKGRPAQWETGASVFENSCDWALREVARRIGATGKMLCPVAACAGGAHAIAIGAQWSEDGLCDVVVCGAIEAELADLVLAGYKQLGALSESKIMRPFDKDRDGFVPSPGAAVLILENAETVGKRSSGVLGAIAGSSVMCDASSLTGLEPSGKPIMRAMENALARGSTPGANLSVDYVNAHGTATRMNDATEALALAGVLGADIPVSSTKSLTGHMLGAAGAVEAVLSLLAMQQNYAPPNLNLRSLDENCEINVIGEGGRETLIETAMSLSYGFGGHIGVLVFRKE